MGPGVLLIPKHVRLSACSITHEGAGVHAHVRRAPRMGSGFLPKPMSSMDVGSSNKPSLGFLGARLGLPRSSLLSLNHLLYFELRVSSMISEVFLLDLFLGNFLSPFWEVFLGIFYMDLSCGNHLSKDWILAPVISWNLI